MRPNSPPQTTSVSSQQAARLQVAQQRGDGPVAVAGVGAVVDDVVVVVPRLVVAVVDLHHAHAALGQPAGDQAGVGELARAVALAAPPPAPCPGRRRPCASDCMRKAISSDWIRASSWPSRPRSARCSSVHLLQQVELPALLVPRQVAVLQVADDGLAGRSTCC